MPNKLQEKFEVRPKAEKNDDSHSGWITDAQARAKKQMPGREGLPGGDYNSRYMNNAVHFNSLPPGMDIEDQEVNDIRKMEIVTAGTSDRTVDVTAKSLKLGFDRKAMSPTEDMYTREHNDAFYDEISMDGVTGYLERNNVLDRL